MLPEPVPHPEVYLLDHSSAAGAVFVECARQLDFQLLHFTQSREFIAAVLAHQPACVILEIEHDPSGTEIQAELTRRGNCSCVIATSRGTDVATAVRVMELGALTLLELPLEASRLETYLRRALGLARIERELEHTYLRFKQQHDQLTSRQIAVLTGVVNGWPTKTIAADLDVSIRLIELERSRLLKVFETESTTELAMTVGKFLILKRLRERGLQPHFANLRSTARSASKFMPDDT